MTVQEVLRRTQTFFKEKGFHTARLDAELLISHTLGWERVTLYTKFDYPMNEIEMDTCREAVRRRANGEPVAYILGKKGFFKDEFFVDSNVLIPRPETEILAELAIAHGKSAGAKTVIDLGTGSGCLGLTVLKETAAEKLYAFDVSEKALAVARKNAFQLGLEDRVEFICSDVKSVELPTAELIVANPPYIAEDDEEIHEDVKKFEPGVALFAQENGFSEIFAWTEKALAVLRPGGKFFCETGARQKSEIEGRFGDQYNLEFYKDYAGLDRGFSIQVK